MTRTIIITIIAMTILISFQLSNEAEAQAGTVFEEIEVEKEVDAPAIPGWVKTTMSFYLDGQISEREILDAFNWLFDNNIMHLSEKAALEVQEMRNEIEDLKYELEETKAAIAIPNLLDTRKSANESTSSGDGGGFSIQAGDSSGTATEEALNHLRKAYDLNPNLQTIVIQYDENHDKWISVLSIDWGTTEEQINEIASPTLTPENTFVFAHLLEQSGSASSSLSGTGTSTITVTGLEFADSAVNEIMTKGGTTSAWEEGIAAFSEHGMSESVVDELQGIVVLCNNEIDKKTQQIDAELKMIELWLDIISEKESEYDASGRLTSDTTTESTSQNNQSDLDFITRKLSSIDQQIKALDTGVNVLEEKLQSIGDDAQLANIDLQNALQKQQQTLQTMSNVSKALHDTAMSVIRKIG